MYGKGNGNTTWLGWMHLLFYTYTYGRAAILRVRGLRFTASKRSSKIERIAYYMRCVGFTLRNGNE
jgi:hypothetical protein